MTNGLIEKSVALQCVVNRVGIDGKDATLLDVGKLYGDIYAIPPIDPYDKLDWKISLLVEDIENGHGDYKLLPGFYEVLAIIKEMNNDKH